MAILRFTDGVEIDTSGPLRIEHRRDGLYVVGQGFLCPCNTIEEARRLLLELANPDGSA